MFFGAAVAPHSSARWDQVVNLFGPLTHARGFSSGFPSSYTNGEWNWHPSKGVTSFISFKPNVSSTISGSLDTQLRDFAATIPNGSYVTAWHEPENDVGRAFSSGSQFVAMLDRVYRQMKIGNRTLKIGYAAMAYQWNQSSTSDPGLWTPAKEFCDWVGCDVYSYDWQGDGDWDLGNHQDFQRWHGHFGDHAGEVIITERGISQLATGGTRAHVLEADLAWCATNGIDGYLYWNAAPSGNRSELWVMDDDPQALAVMKAAVEGAGAPPHPLLGRFNNAEGGADNTVVAVDNSGGASGDAFSAVQGSPVFSSAQAAHGSLSYAIASGDAMEYLAWTFPAEARTFGREAFRAFSVGVANALVRLLHGGSQCARIHIQPTGLIRLTDSSNSVVAASSAVLSAGAWHWLEWDITHSSSGDATVKVYNASNTLLATLTGTANFGAACDEVRFGTVAPANANLWLDDLNVNGAGLPGPAGQIFESEVEPNRTCWIDPESPDKHDSTGDLLVKANPNRRALLEWDLSWLPAGALVNSAMLRLRHLGWYGSNPAGRTYHVARLTRTDWVTTGKSTNPAEGGGATWSHASYETMPWTTAGADYTTTGQLSYTVPLSVSTVSLNVLSLTQDAIANRAGKLSLIVYDPNPNGDHEANLGADDITNIGSRPTLAFNYTF